MIRLGFLTTHPIQYQVPLFRELAATPGFTLQVWYCHQTTPQEQAAAGFHNPFEWDIPLLDGYDYRFLKNVARYPSIARFQGVDTPEVGDLVRSRDFDAIVVHGWHYKSAWQAIRACWNSRVPVLVRSDSHMKTIRPLLKRVLKWPLYRWAIPKLDACLPVGQWARDYFVHYGASADRIFIVPHSVDSLRFSTQANELGPNRVLLRQRWHLDSDDVVWLYVGKFIQRKRPLDFIKAVARARLQGAPISGLMVGDGPLRPACESYARQHRAPIEFVGFLNQTQIAQAYVACDGLALPSDANETWGIVVNEAMACGRACFVSDRVGCGPDLIEDGLTGSVFPMGDVNRFTEVLRRYSKSTTLAHMGSLAREKIRQHSTQDAARSLITAVSATLRASISSRPQELASKNVPR